MRMVRTALLVACVFATCGCGTLNGRGWGRDAAWPIDGGRLAKAARDAFLSPHTLLPLAGAAVFAIDDFDERTSDWATKHTPVFGARDDAWDASDDLAAILCAEAIITTLATPSGSESGEWAVAKLRGAAVELTAVGLTSGATGLLKSTFKRDRPDNSNDNSFPSGHASASFSFATLSNRNLDAIEMHEGVRFGVKTFNVLAAYGVAWARVEGRRHYPSDVLFGAAIGHFLTSFIHDGFMNLPENENVDIAVYPADGGIGAAVWLRF